MTSTTFIYFPMDTAVLIIQDLFRHWSKSWLLNLLLLKVSQSWNKECVSFFFLGEVSARQFCFEICCTSPRMENLYTKPNASQQIRRKWIIGINFFNFLYGKNWRWPLFLIQYWTKCMYPLAFANSVQVWLQKNTHLFYKFWLQSAQTVQKFALICISITSLHTFYIVLGN